METHRQVPPLTQELDQTTQNEQPPTYEELLLEATSRFDSRFNIHERVGYEKFTLQVTDAVVTDLTSIQEFEDLGVVAGFKVDPNEDPNLFRARTVYGYIINSWHRQLESVPESERVDDLYTQARTCFIRGQAQAIRWALGYHNRKQVSKLYTAITGEPLDDSLMPIEG